MVDEKDSLTRALEQASVNARQHASRDVTYGLKEGLDVPVLGSGEDAGEYKAQTRIEQPARTEIEFQRQIENGQSMMWQMPRNMAQRQKSVKFHAQAVAGFSDGPVTLHVDWGDDFGKSDFTWSTGGWIMGIPDGKGMADYARPKPAR